MLVFFCKQKTAYEMRISDWSSDVCSSDLHLAADDLAAAPQQQGQQVELPARQRQGLAQQGRLAVHAVEGQRPAGQHDAERSTGTPQQGPAARRQRSEEHTYELQSIMRISYAVFSLK